MKRTNQRTVSKYLSRVVGIVMLLVLLSALLIDFFGGNRLYKWISLGIPVSYSSCEEHFEKGAFQDATDYAKYHYSGGSNYFSRSFRYKEVSEKDIVEIKFYFATCAVAMKSGDRGAEYDFDATCVSVGDEWRLKSNSDSERNRFDDFDLDFYDVETETLYYIHYD